MIFHALEFSIDDTHCSKYGLQILTDQESKEDGSGYQTDLITAKSPLSQKFYYYGDSVSEPLTFKMTVGTTEPIDALLRSEIQYWLFGQSGYRKLKIIQDDMLNLHFQCRFNAVKIKNVGNKPMLIEFDVICDSPYAWEDIKESIYTTIPTSKEIVFNNTSHLIGYTYPIVELKTGREGTVSIINKNDKDREMKFENLMQNEVLTIDCNTGQITTNKDLNRLEVCNKKLLRLVGGINKLTLTGDIVNLKITYQNARMVGM